MTQEQQHDKDEPVKRIESTAKEKAAMFEWLRSIALDSKLLGPNSSMLAAIAVQELNDYGELRRTVPVTGQRAFHICKDHQNPEWNKPQSEGIDCILCRLFYLEAQEEMLEEAQQRAKRAEEAMAEVERPLDAQMARLNETVTRLNEENERLRGAASGCGLPSADWYSEHTEKELRQRWKDATTGEDAPDHMRGESFEHWAEAEGYVRGGAVSATPLTSKLADQLAEAVALFEGDEECQKVGTDAWTWLHVAQTLLREEERNRLFTVSTTQPSEPVAWMWEYVGNDPYAKKYSPVARGVEEMDPKNPPYPDTWRPLYPLVRSATQPITEEKKHG